MFMSLTVLLQALNDKMELADTFCNVMHVAAEDAHYALFEQWLCVLVCKGHLMYFVNSL